MVDSRAKKMVECVGPKAKTRIVRRAWSESGRETGLVNLGVLRDVGANKRKPGRRLGLRLNNEKREAGRGTEAEKGAASKRQKQKDAEGKMHNSQFSC